MSVVHEWPLVLFTVSAQAAVGLHLALLLPRGLPGTPAPPRPAKRPPILVGLLMAGALAFSFFHLGTPLHGVHALSNLSRSWLSREILAALAFTGLWALHFAFGRRPGTGEGMRRGVAWATALAGILLVWSMARIYMIPARPLWDHWLTLAGFFLTALLLGAATAAVYLERAAAASPASPAPLSPPLVVLALGLAAVLAQVAVILANPLTEAAKALPAGTVLGSTRLLLLLAGALLILFPLVRASGGGGTAVMAGRPARGTVAALLLLCISEVVGRMLFYAAGTAEPF